MAAGILDQPLNHQEVLETGERVKGDFIALLRAVIPQIDAAFAERSPYEADAAVITRRCSMPPVRRATTLTRPFPIFAWARQCWRSPAAFSRAAMWKTPATG